MDERSDRFFKTTEKMNEITMFEKIHERPYSDIEKHELKFLGTDAEFVWKAIQIVTSANQSKRSANAVVHHIEKRLWQIKYDLSMYRNIPINSKKMKLLLLIWTKLKEIT